MILVLLVGVVFADTTSTYYAERFKDIQETILCSNSSPFYDIQYGLK
jgi:hypothetical protein